MGQGFSSQQIAELLAACGVPAARLEDVDTLRNLYKALIATNQRDNLTAITDERDYWYKHVADSLAIGTILPRILTEPLTVADVGCGAGFPLLVLGWANPKLRIVGFEPRGKKAAFVRSQIDAMGLKRCDILDRQAREAGRMDEHAEQYDLVLLRAVGPAGRMIRECRNLLRSEAGSTMIFYKTPEAIKIEYDLALREAEKYHLTLGVTPIVELPQQAGTRQFLTLRSEEFTI